MGLKGDSGDGCVRSYQVPSKVQSEAGYACEGRMKSIHGCMGVHGGAWGRFMKIHGAYMYCTQRGRDGCPCPL
jgi:hypothetical protein